LQKKQQQIKQHKNIKHVLIILRKENALRKHSMHGKVAASVLIKLFINGNEKCYSIEAL